MSNWYQDPTGHGIVREKYLHEGEAGFADAAKRITACFSPCLQQRMKAALLNADFFPAGRSLYALGCKGKFRATTSNCYVMPSPSDDLSSIFDVGKQMALIFANGGGCGVNLSRLRPRGSAIRGGSRTATGAVSFMELYNTIGSIISQGGRRGALLMGLDCSHPDVEEFLQVKQNNEAIQSANISVLFHDSFLQAAQKGAIYELRFDVAATGEKIRRTINAGDFFRGFCESNRDYAEPGAIFMDRVRNWHLLSADPCYRIEISNPCGEFFGNAYNTCNLGSVNLYNLVENRFTAKAHVDKARLCKQVDLAVRALDEILDYGYDLQPLDENRQNITDYRAIGLGVFGLGDALIALGLRYGSPESCSWVAVVFREIFLQALRTSCELAREKGAFAMSRPELLRKAPILEFVQKEDPALWENVARYGLRNASLLSVAPTGTIATMCGLSGGIEPLFGISYKRTTHVLVKEGKCFNVFARSVKDLMVHHGLKDLGEEEIRKRFPFVVTAHDIDPLERVSMQGAIQKYVDNAISSTVNMKEGSTTDEVMAVYRSAWEAGCKGVTVFVDGCRRTAILGRR